MALTKNDRIIISAAILIYFLFMIFLPRFPFQRNSLFADAPTTYETYEIFVDGHRQSLSQFQLQNPYDGDPQYIAGRRFPTAYRWGELLSDRELENHFKKLTAIVGTSGPFCIHRVVWGESDGGNLGRVRDEWLLWDSALRILASPQEHASCQEKT